VDKSARRGPGRPQGSSATETRERIVKAAPETFSEVGYDAATFQAIARTANLTRPAINHYFRDKQTLYRQVVEQTTNQVFASGMTLARNESTLMAQLVAFVAGANAIGPSTVAFLATAAHEPRRNPGLLAVDSDCPEFAKEFAKWALGDAVERDELSPVPSVAESASLTELLASLLWGMEFHVGYVDSHDVLLRAARS
jgi:AcrR family transcriptional regulator